MLDLLLIPSVVLVALALRAVRRGDHRLHGHLMTTAFTLVGLRVLLYSRSLAPRHATAWLLIGAAAAATILLGRMALAWREGRSPRAGVPRIHRTFGTLSLSGLAVTLLFWLLRTR